MAGYWTITNRAAAGNASAVQAAPTAAATAGALQCRLRSYSVTVASAAGLQILDGAAVIYQLDYNAAGGDRQAGLDIRATAGNSLTIQVTGNTGNSDVNASGDFVPVGYPWGLS